MRCLGGAAFLDAFFAFFISFGYRSFPVYCPIPAQCPYDPRDFLNCDGILIVQNNNRFVNTQGQCRSRESARPARGTFVVMPVRTWKTFHLAQVRIQRPKTCTAAPRDRDFSLSLISIAVFRGQRTSTKGDHRSRHEAVTGERLEGAFESAAECAGV